MSKVNWMLDDGKNKEENGWSGEANEMVTCRMKSQLCQEPFRPRRGQTLRS